MIFPNQRQPSVSRQAKWNTEFLNLIVKRASHNLLMQTRSAWCQNHPNSFTGASLIAWVKINEFASSEEEGTDLCQYLMSEGLLCHVMRDSQFRPSNELYRFTKYEDHGCAIKERGKWADLVDVPN